MEGIVFRPGSFPQALAVPDLDADEADADTGPSSAGAPLTLQAVRDVLKRRNSQSHRAESPRPDRVPHCPGEGGGEFGRAMGGGISAGACCRGGGGAGGGGALHRDGDRPSGGGAPHGPPCFEHRSTSVAPKLRSTPQNFDLSVSWRYFFGCVLGGSGSRCGVGTGPGVMPSGACSRCPSPRASLSLTTWDTGNWGFTAKVVVSARRDSRHMDVFLFSLFSVRIPIEFILGVPTQFETSADFFCELNLISPVFLPRKPHLRLRLIWEGATAVDSGLRDCLSPPRCRTRRKGGGLPPARCGMPRPRTPSLSPHPSPTVPPPLYLRPQVRVGGRELGYKPACCFYVFWSDNRNECNTFSPYKKQLFPDPINH